MMFWLYWGLGIGMFDYFFRGFLYLLKLYGYRLECFIFIKILRKYGCLGDI